MPAIELSGRVEVYADEAGTMPLEDHHDPFVVATVACNPGLEAPQIHPPERKLLYPREVVSLLESSNSIPMWGIVEPGPGYGSALRLRTAQANYYGGITKQIDARNAAYLSDDGIHRRNWIWVHSMVVEVGLVILERIVRGLSVPELVTLHLHRKTLTDEDRNLLRKQLLLIGPRLCNHFRAAAERGQSNAHPTLLALAEFMARNPCRMQGHFCGDEGCPGSAGGMMLAHSLASDILRDLRGIEVGMVSKLLAAGFANGYDLTPEVTRPIAKQVLRKWKRRTGLKLV